MMTERKDDKLSKLKQVQEKLCNVDKYKKYATINNQILKQHIVAKASIWAKTNVIANATLFILGSVMWMYNAHIRSFDPDYDKQGGPKTGPYLEHRTYLHALKDAYWPMVNGEFSPGVDWNLTIGLILTFAICSLAGIGVSAKNSYKKHIKAAQAQVDVMLEIDKLAKEHNLDATTAKKVLNIAPEIVKRMSEDSRVYFDMIMDGKVSPTDENFINTASAVMVGHLQTHPEDMELVMSIFDEKVIPQEVLAMHMQKAKR